MRPVISHLPNEPSLAKQVAHMPSRVRIADKLADLLIDARDVLAMANDLRCADPDIADRLSLFADCVYENADALMDELTT